MDHIHVLLAERDSLWKSSVELCLSEEPDLCLVGTVKTREELLNAVRSLRIHVVLMDFPILEKMSDVMEAVFEIVKAHNSKVIMLSDERREEWIIESLAHSVSNFVSKSYLPDIPEAIRAAHRNRSPIHFSSAWAVRNELVRMKMDAWRQQLTVTETTVLRLVDQGQSHRQMAESLFISESTVKKHINHILKKYRVGSSKEAARKARMRGVL